MPRHGSSRLPPLSHYSKLVNPNSCKPRLQAPCMNHTMLKIRTRLAGTAVLTLALASTAWAHNPWPPTDQPVQIVVTAPPGSVDATIARLVAEQLGSRLGSRRMVSTHAGANGNAGARPVARTSDGQGK